VLAASCLAGASTFLVSGAFAQSSFSITGTFTWNSTATDSWYNPARWNDGLGSTLPSFNDDTRLNTGGTILVDAPGVEATAYQLIVGDDVGNSGTIGVSAGTLSSIGDVRIGGNAGPEAGQPGPLGGTGTLLQTGGVINVGTNLNIGVGGHINTPSTVTGYARISGGTLNVGTATGNFITVGNGAGVTGTIDQVGGWVESKGSVILGRNSGTVTQSIGTYNISNAGSTLKLGQDFFVGGMSSGVGGIGIVNQGVDTNVLVTRSVFIGAGGAATLNVATYSTSATGTYTMSGGTLTVGTSGQPDALAVGAGTGGFGTFVQNGGFITCNNLLQLGRQNSTGVYQLNAGSILVNGPFFVGGGNSQADGIGTFTQAASTTIDLKDNMNVGGTGVDSRGQLTTSGTITFTKTSGGQIMAVGNVGAGTLTMLSGSSISNPNGLVEIGRNAGTGNFIMSNNTTLSAGSLSLAANTPATGAATLSVPTGANVSTGTLTVGATASSTTDKQLLITGGSVSLSTINFGTTANTTKRLIQLSSGTLGVGTSAMIGQNGTITVAGGSFNLNNGTFTAPASSTGGGALNLQAGTGSINAATFTNSGVGNISGGTGTITLFSVASTSTLNITGGSYFLGGGTIGSGGTLRTTIPLTIPNQIAFGTGTVQVDSDTLTFAGTSLFPASRTLTKTGAGTLVIAGPVSAAPSATANGFTTSAGTLRIDTDAGTTVTVNANGGTTSFGSTQHLAALNVGTDAFAEARAGGNKVLVTSALSISGGATPAGKLDLADNDMVVDYTTTSPLTTIQLQIASAYTGGSWTGNGITSSSAAAASGSAHKTALGYGESSVVLGPTGGTFSGQAVDGTAVLARYTYAGDANLDGIVDTLDFNSLAANFGGSDKVWTQADFNYDAVVDTLDFNFLAGNFGQTQPSISGGGSTLGALVPEPASSLLATPALVGALALRSRRRPR
jgi:hypothetical protein